MYLSSAIKGSCSRLFSSINDNALLPVSVRIRVGTMGDINCSISMYPRIVLIYKRTNPAPLMGKVKIITQA